MTKDQVRWDAYAKLSHAQQTRMLFAGDRSREFNRLILPGSPPATLGTFDVDP
jgi:hypothetical protein